MIVLKRQQDALVVGMVEMRASGSRYPRILAPPAEVKSTTCSAAPADMLRIETPSQLPRPTRTVVRMVGIGDAPSRDRRDVIRVSGSRHSPIYWGAVDARSMSDSVAGCWCCRVALIVRESSIGER
jgi:hypothetical protein